MLCVHFYYLRQIDAGSNVTPFQPNEIEFPMFWSRQSDEWDMRSSICHVLKLNFSFIRSGKECTMYINTSNKNIHISIYKPNAGFENIAIKFQDACALSISFQWCDVRIFWENHSIIKSPNFQWLRDFYLLHWMGIFNTEAIHQTFWVSVVWLYFQIIEFLKTYNEMKWITMVFSESN